MAENILTRKYGPIPGWGWAGIAAIGGALWIRHRNAQAAASSTDTSGTDTTAYDDQAADDLQDAAGQASQDYGAPYNGAGVYTDLATAQAREQKLAEQEAATKKRLRRYETNHPAGAVNLRTRVYTAHARETLAAIASRFGVTVAEIRKANPHLTGNVVSKGERIHIPTEAPRKAKR